MERTTGKLERVIPNLGLLVAAAGASRRFGGARSKLLVPLHGHPVFSHCLRTFVPRVVAPRLVVLLVPRRQRHMFEEALAEEEGRIPDITLVEGGESRQDSVCIGLRALPPDATIVAVQDAARPYTTEALLRACAQSACARGSGVAARRVTDTIKIADAHGRVLSTPDRSTMWATETPQVFCRDLLTAGYRKARESGLTVTDDAQAVELLDEPVFLVEHQGRNPKVTYPADLTPAGGGDAPLLSV